MKTESLPTHKSSMQHSFIIDVEIVNAYGLRLTQKSLTKTESLPTKKSSMQHSFIADVEIVNAYGLLPPLTENIATHYSQISTCNSSCFIISMLTTIIHKHISILFIHTHTCPFIISTKHKYYLVKFLFMLQLVSQSLITT
jgi:hypothetical protein